MRKAISLLFLLISTLIPFSAHAILSMELTRGVSGAIPIAVVPFAQGESTPPQPVSDIVSNDLQNSGRFKVYGRQALTQTPSDVAAIQSSYFRGLGTDNVVIGRIKSLGGDTYQVSFDLVDTLNGDASVHPNVVLSKTFTVTGSRALRAVAHHISDLVYQQITGTRGVFSTRLAYVVVQHGYDKTSHYTLEVSDQDGYDPRPILSSNEPIMSPSWAPNGQQLAYVSFEKKHANIYLHSVNSGSRTLLSSYPGINGAPAWSADGRKLALVLSKSGSPNVYVMDIASRSLKQVTNDYYINTEPSWAPDGKSLIFTSNRSGGPQIYQADLASGNITRLTYDGDYNARASFTSDGNHVAMIHKVSGVYKIAILDLDSGTTRVLNSASGDSSSPSVAPNGSMILYDTVSGGRNVLGMVSADGRIQLELPARNGEAQDPAWSPFLS